MPNIIRIVGYCSITPNSKGQGREHISSDDGKVRLEELALKVICVFMRERKFNI